MTHYLGPGRPFRRPAVGPPLIGQMGHGGMYISWFSICKGSNLCSGEGGKSTGTPEQRGRSRRLVTNGIYGHIRHPQYTGFMLITLGMIFEWATLPLLIMWPLLAAIYYRLAKKEEGDMEAEFGRKYAEYRRKTGMFLPRLWASPQLRAAGSS